MNKKLRVAINGFGRMGRLVFRELFDRNEVEVVQINEIAGDAICGAHLLEFDSVHGRWDRGIRAGENSFLLPEGGSILYTKSADIIGAQYDQQNIDLMIECSGTMRTEKLLQPFYDAGIKKVLVSCPVKDEVALNLVYGVNHHLYKADEHHLITAASCTTNCLAPVVKVLQEKVGINHGHFTTIHDITNTQTIIDAPHKDLRRARACGESLIPTSTGSASAIALIYPELKGLLHGIAVRVPLLNGSLVDGVFEMKRDITAEEINSLFAEAAENELKDILGYEERPLVSVDYLNERRSGVIDALTTSVINKRQVKFLAWYDNEWGYICRMADIVSMIAKA